jgi:hypothetical protein
VTADLLTMSPGLDPEHLKIIITNYENIIGELLTDNNLNMQSV